MFKRLLKFIKAIVLFVWLVLLLLIGARFTQLNSQPLSVDLIIWQTPAVSSGLMICLVFAIGLVVGVLAVAPLMMWNSRRVKKLKTTNHALKQKSANSLPEVIQ